ncbi:MAG: 3,4-dihydroxy-2-butanone-4-phosphate synthase [Planctomycetota bacterium]|nr:MAG: 3,4-dihydroxy-2-butanone-4-phosphate synthase [Planctomycetota bacterium]
MALASIPEILDDLRQGKMVILVDDPGRENEGDVCIAAEFCTPETINFMRKECGGLICLSLTGEACDRLGLPPQTSENTTPHGTGFTVSIEAREGVTTGISAQDRAHTVQTAIRDGATAGDLVRPGHVFPLRARDGGVLVRAGHTEAIVDLVRLAECKPAGVICEVMNEDGTMARLPDLELFAKRHGMKVAAISELVEHRRRRERIIERLDVLEIESSAGVFDMHPYRSKTDDVVHVALTHGIPRAASTELRYPALEEPVAVRVHAANVLSDVFEAYGFNSGPPLSLAMKRIGEEPLGVLLFIRHSNRGLRVEPEILREHLRKEGLDDAGAPSRVGFWTDPLEYGTGAQILHDLGVRKMKLLTNSPKKLAGLSGYGLEIVDQIPVLEDPE